MSLFAQIILSALLVGGIGAGVWTHNRHESPTQPPAQEQRDDRSDIGAQASVSLSVGTTNKDLESDLSSIDAQIQAVNDGSGEVDTSWSTADAEASQ